MGYAEDKIAKRVGVKEYATRLDAGLVYITQPHMTIEMIHADPRWSHLNRDTLNEWSHKDEWVRKRKEHLDKWLTVAQQRLGTKLVRAKMDEYKRLQAMQDLAEFHLTDGSVKPKSWEGVARVRLEIGRRMEDIAGSVLEEVLPKDEASAHETAVANVELSEDQRQELAAKLLEMRRKAHASDYGHVIDAGPRSDDLVKDRAEDEVSSVGSDGDDVQSEDVASSDLGDGSGSV